ncbi:LLM class flavin-dependent oxidoreductase [Rhodopila sp.]|uniref:LLM class flavin-dependent oxidoreductase n=1 Tax=Rhodopila sp. TaxID=2480087 RepID=UPI002BA1D434|nr:LLM class flavin-dependent oxidoreductase [Rhodopila sp.]HVZ09571.1 LLM class flavin-dependent oxidoreductase [Rhodopila sp.]
MKIGLFVPLEWEAAGDDGRHLANTLDLVRTAKEAGFSSLWLPQHFVTGPAMRQLATSPVLGLLAGLAEGMTLGTGVLLLPMLNPVLLAEEAATLDHLTGGKFILGVGLGYRAPEFQAFGVEMRSRVPRFREYIEVMRLLWSRERVTFHGRYLHFDDVGLSLRPTNGTGVPVWVGSAVDDGVKRAAAIGDSWICAGAMSRTDLARWWGLFHETRIALGRTTNYPRQIARECFCGPDMKTALALAAGPLSAKYARYAANGWYDFSGPDGFAAFAKDRFVIGDDAFVRDELQRYRDEFGATEFRFRMAWPGLPQAEALASIRRVGRIAATL